MPHTEWMALLLMHDPLPADASDQAIAEIVRAGIRDPDGEFKIKHIGRRQINHMGAEQYRKDRVFVAGGAAHRHPPANGPGSNTSIQGPLRPGLQTRPRAARRRR
ncbi:FAD-dependent monooxygenase [Streptomyces sp. NPDC086519]|uniref:FAD-dependent monooxygenase n=1 Tax=unclassified Streptomyces TaxID=2593676 RepID=UPI00343CC6AB